MPALRLKAIEVTDTSLELIDENLGVGIYQVLINLIK